MIPEDRDHRDQGPEFGEDEFETFLEMFLNHEAYYGEEKIKLIAQKYIQDNIESLLSNNMQSMKNTLEQFKVR